jgi:S1-C subfamily serine protease
VSLELAAGEAVTPAVNALVGHGLALTAQTTKMAVVVAATIVMVGGAGYAIVAGTSATGGESGHPVAIVPTTNTQPERPPMESTIKASEVYQKAVDGCVYIVNANRTGIQEGSGALVDEDRRLVVTTCHVVGDSDVVEVQVPRHRDDGTVETVRQPYFARYAARQAIKGKVIYRDPAHDVAILRLDRLVPTAHALQLADAAVGTTVLHIGTAGDNVFAMAVRTVQPIDAADATVDVVGVPQNIAAQMIRVTGSTEDSGGLLVDKDGRLIGLMEGAATCPSVRNATLALDVAELRAALSSAILPPPAPKPRDEPEIPFIPMDSSPTRPEAPGVPTNLPTVEPLRLSGEWGSDPTAELYKHVVDCAVFIVTPLKGGFVMGSGVLIDKDRRYILTNYHVVDEVEKILVQFPIHLRDGEILKDKKRYLDRIPTGDAIKGTVLYRDKTRDLAIVKLEKLPPTAKQAMLAKKSPETGSATWKIGSPGAVSLVFSPTGGAVRTVVNEDMVVGGVGEVLHIKAKMVTTTNPTNPGDSGGPLFNRKGEVVAITENGAPGGAVQQINRFIDVTEVWAFLKEKKIVPMDADSPRETETEKPKSGLDNAPRTVPPLHQDPVDPKTPMGPTTDNEERWAAQMLSRAKLFKDDEEDREIYKKKLKEVITKYPNTKAAAEAKKLLQAIPK